MIADIFPQIQVVVGGTDVFHGNCIRGNTYGNYVSLVADIKKLWNEFVRTEDKIISPGIWGWIRRKTTNPRKNIREVIGIIKCHK